MSCNKLLTDNLINDCSVDPILGLTRGVAINYSDIDWSATTVDGATITNLSLLSGKKGYEITWLKRMGSNNNNLVASPTEREGFTHAFACQLAGYSAENAERINELKNGKFLIVAESNFGGVDNADKFKVFGFTSGLYLTEAVHNSNENSGAITYILSTMDGDLEKYIYQVLLETDYETTKADFEALFEAV